MYQSKKDNEETDALSHRFDSKMLWTMYETDEVEIDALNGVGWKIWEKIQDVTQLDVKAIKITELLEAQSDGVTGYKLMDDLIYYKDSIYVPNVPN